jgi:pilus assembly protein Flp/PilA
VKTQEFGGREQTASGFFIYDRHAAHIAASLIEGSNMLTNPSIKAYLFVKNAVCGLRDDVRGATLIEYTVLIGLLTAAVIGTINTVGGDISQTWTTLQNNLTTPAAP